MKIGLLQLVKRPRKKYFLEMKSCFFSLYKLELVKNKEKERILTLFEKEVKKSFFRKTQKYFVF